MGYEDNCVNLDGSLDAPIFRVFTIDRLLEVLQTRRLALVRPQLWDDPFENFLYQLPVVTARGVSVSIKGLKKRLFGQCWSLTEESDAMWRIFSPLKNGVKVRTTVRKLMRAFYNDADEFAQLSYFIGRVEYEDEAALLSLFTNPERLLGLITDMSGRGPVIGLLHKRREFEPENEVRLVYQNTKETPDDVEFFSIDPFALFDEIVFDPRMGVYAYEAFSNYLKAQGFTKPVRQSGLYRLPTVATRVII